MSIHLFVIYCSKIAGSSSSLKRSSQLLMTTHDINLLNEDFIRRDVVWFTDKSKEGATQVKRLSSLSLHKTMNPYNAYKQGMLVDLPFLGSFYLETE